MLQTYMDALSELLERWEREPSKPGYIPPAPTVAKLADLKAEGQPRPKVRVGGTVEALTCESCGSAWERPLTRGRKPRLCPSCSGRMSLSPIDEEEVFAPIERAEGTIESLVCSVCGVEFSRRIVRGRKPTKCEECR